jgi:hypothetical protein
VPFRRDRSTLWKIIAWRALGGEPRHAVAVACALLRGSHMRNIGLVAAVTVSALAAAHHAHAGNGDVAAGLLGGFAAGAIVGSVLAPRPAPVYVAPAPVYVVPQCYWTRGQPMWDGYRWVRTRVQVCD